MPTEPLDMAQDPDRYDPERDTSALPAPYDGSGEGRTLTGLLGDGAHEERREPYTWLFGLALVFGFLLLVTLLAHA